MRQCHICGKLLRSNNHARHVLSHSKLKKQVAFHIQDSWKITGQQYCCPVCSKVFSKRGIVSHLWKAHKEGISHRPSTGKGRVPWNKGLTKENDNRIALAAKKIKEAVSNSIKNGTFKVCKMSIDARNRQSKRMSSKNLGGRSKWFDIDGKKVQGTWEKRIAEKMVSLEITWERGTRHSVQYLLDEKERTYTPDFYLKEIDCLLEIKGYWWGHDKEKMTLIMKQDLKTRITIIEKEQFEKLLSCNSKDEFYGLLA